MLNPPILFDIQNKRVCCVYGSQTGTAEDYALRIAKEIKQKFGVSSLVVDPEEWVHLSSLKTWQTLGIN